MPLHKVWKPTAVRWSDCYCRRRALTRRWWSEGRTGFSGNWIAWDPCARPALRTLRVSSAEAATTRYIQVLKRDHPGPRELLTPCYSTRCRFMTDLWAASLVGASTAAPAGKVRIHSQPLEVLSYCLTALFHLLTFRTARGRLHSARNFHFISITYTK
jgi:hypothetical protein